MSHNLQARCFLINWIIFFFFAFQQIASVDGKHLPDFYQSLTPICLTVS